MHGAKKRRTTIVQHIYCRRTLLRLIASSLPSYVISLAAFKQDRCPSETINEMRGAGASDSRSTRLLSSRHLSGRFHLHEESQEIRGSETSKTSASPTNRPPSALQSTGHRLIHDEMVQPDPKDLRDAPPKAALSSPSRQSLSHLSGQYQVYDTGLATSREGVLSMIHRHSINSQQFNMRFQPQDIELLLGSKHELAAPSASSRPSSAAKRSGRLQVHDSTTSASIQEVPSVTLSRRSSRQSTPARDFSSHPQATIVEMPVKKQELPAKPVPPLSPIRQPSERLKIHDSGALPSKNEHPLKAALPILPVRQPSQRLQVLGNGAVSTKRKSSVGLAKEGLAPNPGAVENWDNEAQGTQEAMLNQSDEQNNIESASDVANTTMYEVLQTSSTRFVPLHSQWTYGQSVFGRYKRTPYFYSGHIATYLGSGMFMIVFDDGTLDYRVRREDIVLREPFTTSSAQQKMKQRRNSGLSREEEVANTNGASFTGLEMEKSNGKSQLSTDVKLRRQSYSSGEHCLDPSEAPELDLPPSHHVMVDFSTTPPKEMILSFDDSGAGCANGCAPCGIIHPDSRSWRLLLDDETLTMKRLECGVGYEDDSTQVSDSDDSSDEDMSMTPWQQMTQSFGMGKPARPQRGTGRRSSISSVSQVDRLSLTHMSMKKAPKSLKQIITEYFMRGNKKVQPAQPSEELELAEHIRLMEAKLTTMRSTRCNSTNFGSGASAHQTESDMSTSRVVYERAPDGIRAYGTITKRVENSSYAVVTEDDQSISVQVVPEDKVDILPSMWELEQQLTDLERSQRVLFAGQKVQVSLYPGSRFSGCGLITLEKDYQSRFHVLLSNRIRLVNVPADSISPMHEKKKVAVTITEDQFLVCSNKVRVYIGDQIYVKSSAGSGDLDITAGEEKLGLLNGVYSNRTAAVDFADGSTGYEVPPHLIFKRKRTSVPADQDVRSLKNAVLMQASAGASRNILPILEEGYQVKADHPRKVAVESCVVIKTHPSSACDLRFSDGTIAFEVFPSQMILDSVDQQRTLTKTTATSVMKEHSFRTMRYSVGDYVLAWSSRFGRYCSAKIAVNEFQDLSTTAPETIAQPSANSDGMASPTVHSIAMATSTPHYTVVFDYGESKTLVPPDKITRLDDATALSHTQKLTNYSIDAMGFELTPVNFTVSEAVMARVHGTPRYYNGIVENVDDKERVCAVCFDSSERDTAVPFSAMFSVDTRSRFTGRGSSIKKATSSSAEARFISRHRATDDPAATLETITRHRRNSSGSVGNLLKSVADNFFRSRSKTNLVPRRGSHMITEIGARVRVPQE